MSLLLNKPRWLWDTPLLTYACHDHEWYITNYVYACTSCAHPLTPMPMHIKNMRVYPERTKHCGAWGSGLASSQSMHISDQNNNKWLLLLGHELGPNPGGGGGPLRGVVKVWGRGLKFLAREWCACPSAPFLYDLWIPLPSPPHFVLY